MASRKDEREARRQAEMARGQEVNAHKFFAKTFDPNYRDSNESEAHARPSADNKAYRERMQRQVRND